jgi:hypothetical protein
MFTITVTYTDGTKEVFEQTPEGDAAVLTSRLSQVLGGTALHLGLEDGLLSIPLTSIKCIQVSPALPSVPASVVRNVRRVSPG